MPPKPTFSPNQCIIVHIRCVGGQLCSVPALQVKLRGLGLSAKKVALDLVTATSDWKGQRVTCKLTVQSGLARIDVVPTAENLLHRQWTMNSPGEIKSSGRYKGNLSFEQILNVARQMRNRSMARKLEGTAKEILGTAQCAGYTVNGRTPQEILVSINNGEIVVPEEYCVAISGMLTKLREGFSTAASGLRDALIGAKCFYTYVGTPHCSLNSGNRADVYSALLYKID